MDVSLIITRANIDINGSNIDSEKLIEKLVFEAVLIHTHANSINAYVFSRAKSDFYFLRNYGPEFGFQSL